MKQDDILKQINNCRKEAELLTGINYIIAGWLYKDGDINEIPIILDKIKSEYKYQIKRESD